MKVTELEPGFFEVLDGQRWWTASYKEGGGWFIVNEHGRTIRNTGTQGKKILAALEGNTPVG